MATHLIQVTLISLLAASAAALSAPPSLQNLELSMAAREMQHASYFSFIMLIKMVQDKLPSNATFLMPSDRMLSRIFITKDEVMEFLLRHSIPSPLLFDDLEHLPSGTLLPTYQPDYMIKVSNYGRKRFYLNNAQLVLPNVCTTGLSFRCHGIKGVMDVTSSPKIDVPFYRIKEAPPPPVAPGEPSPVHVLPTPPPRTSSPNIAVSPSPAAFDHIPRKSSASAINLSMVIAAIIPFLVFSLVNNPI
ncbi:FAS1 domain-containing protein [Canna indica]|uniref:FAS1 domain-containing protein n=1 Tax=Canna indica TaxID=4628 RepID=A0AAQ3QEI6_9LILI|nr:FAS1 domain-containing protein [Canna indica]